MDIFQRLRLIESFFRALLVDWFGGIAWEMEKNFEFEYKENHSGDLMQDFRYPSFTVNVWPNGKPPKESK